jgi:hypothetical protein
LAKLVAENPLIGSKLAGGISAEIAQKAVRYCTKTPSKIMGALNTTYIQKFSARSDRWENYEIIGTKTKAMCGG